MLYSKCKKISSEFFHNIDLCNLRYLLSTLFKYIGIKGGTRRLQDEEWVVWAL